MISRAQLDEDGYTPLHVLLRDSSVGYSERLKSLDELLASDVDVDAVDKSGYAPLHAAVTYGTPDVPALERLLKAGADPNLVDGQGNTPLMMIFNHFSFEGQSTLAAVELLLQAGADPNIVGSSGHSPLGLLLYQGVALTGAGYLDIQSGDYRTPLFEMLIEGGAESPLDEWMKPNAGLVASKGLNLPGPNIFAKLLQTHQDSESVGRLLVWVETFGMQASLRKRADLLKTILKTATEINATLDTGTDDSAAKEELPKLLRVAVMYGLHDELERLLQTSSSVEALRVEDKAGISLATHLLLFAADDLATTRLLLQVSTQEGIKLDVGSALVEASKSCNPAVTSLLLTSGANPKAISEKDVQTAEFLISGIDDGTFADLSEEQAKSLRASELLNLQRAKEKQAIDFAWECPDRAINRRGSVSLSDRLATVRQLLEAGAQVPTTQAAVAESEDLRRFATAPPQSVRDIHSRKWVYDRDQAIAEQLLALTPGL